MSDKDDKILAAIHDYFEKNTEARGEFWDMRMQELNGVKDELKLVKETIAKNNSTLQEIRIEFAKTFVKQENQDKKVKEHEDKIYVLDAHRNKSLGLTAIIGAAFGSIISWLIHLVTKGG